MTYRDQTSAVVLSDPSVKRIQGFLRKAAEQYTGTARLTAPAAPPLKERTTLYYRCRGDHGTVQASVKGDVLVVTVASHSSREDAVQTLDFPTTLSDVLTFLHDSIEPPSAAKPPTKKMPTKKTRKRKKRKKASSSDDNE